MQYLLKLLKINILYYLLIFLFLEFILFEIISLNLEKIIEIIFLGLVIIYNYVFGLFFRKFRTKSKSTLGRFLHYLIFLIVNILVGIFSINEKSIYIEIDSSVINIIYLLGLVYVVIFFLYDIFKNVEYYLDIIEKEKTILRIFMYYFAFLLFPIALFLIQKKLKDKINEI